MRQGVHGGVLGLDAADEDSVARQISERVAAQFAAYEHRIFAVCLASLFASIAFSALLCWLTGRQLAITTAQRQAVKSNKRPVSGAQEREQARRTHRLANQFEPDRPAVARERVRERERASERESERER